MTLYAWGTNAFGELGLGHKSEQEVEPRPVCLDDVELRAEDIVEIAGGGSHTLILDSSGHVYSCGDNSKGQLGQNDDCAKLRLVDILKGYKIVQIACGWDFSAAVSECEKLFVWGNNQFTQLGLSKSITCTSIPSRLQVSLKLATGFKQVSCGLRHMAVRTKEDGILVAGSGKKGQLGLGKNFPEDSYLSISKVPLEKVTVVACGEHHTVAVLDDDKLMSWGDNKWGQLGLEIEEHKWELKPVPVPLGPKDKLLQVRSGWTYCAALTNKGDVYTWGRNTYGQLGSNRTGDCSAPQKVPSLKNVRFISLGSEHAFSLTKDGKLFAWGWNEHGNCGTGDTENVSTPQHIFANRKVKLVAACTSHSFAVIE